MSRTRHLGVSRTFWWLREFLVRGVGHVSGEESVRAHDYMLSKDKTNLRSSIRTVSMVMSRVQLARQGNLAGSTYECMLVFAVPVCIRQTLVCAR